MPTAEIKGKISLDDAGVETGLKAATSHIDSWTKSTKAKVQSTANDAGGSFDRAFAGIGKVGAGFAVFETLRKVSTEAVNASMEMESLRTALMSTGDSSTTATAQMERFIQIAKQPGLGLPEVAKGALQLQAVGVSAERSAQLISQVGNALTAAGKGKAELDGVMLALTQMAAKGGVFAQEINQIAERMPQIRSLMKGAFGTSDTEKIQAMGVSPEEFFAAFVAQAEKQIPKVGTTLKTEMENAGDSVRQLLAAYGDGIKPLVGAIVLGVGKAAENLGAVLKNWKNLLNSKEDVSFVDGAADFEAQMIKKQQEWAAEREAQEAEVAAAERAAEVRKNSILDYKEGLQRAARDERYTRAPGMSDEARLQQLEDLKRKGVDGLDSSRTMREHGQHVAEGDIAAAKRKMEYYKKDKAAEQELEELREKIAAKNLRAEEDHGKEIAAQEEARQKHRQKEAADNERKKQHQADVVKGMADELTMARARATGDKAVVEQAEAKLRFEERIAKLKEVGKTDAEARSMATALYQAEMSESGGGKERPAGRIRHNGRHHKGHHGIDDVWAYQSGQTPSRLDGLGFGGSRPRRNTTASATSSTVESESKRNAASGMGMQLKQVNSTLVEIRNELKASATKPKAA